MPSITRSQTQPKQTSLEAAVAAPGGTTASPESGIRVRPNSGPQAAGRDKKRPKLRQVEVSTTGFHHLNDEVLEEISRKFSLGSTEVQAMASNSTNLRRVLRPRATADKLVNRLELAEDGSLLGATGLIAVLEEAEKEREEGKLDEAMHVEVICAVTGAVGKHCTTQDQVAIVLPQLLRAIGDLPAERRFMPARMMADSLSNSMMRGEPSHYDLDTLPKSKRDLNLFFLEFDSMVGELHPTDAAHLSSSMAAGLYMLSDPQTRAAKWHYLYAHPGKEMQPYREMLLRGLCKNLIDLPFASQGQAIRSLIEELPAFPAQLQADLLAELFAAGTRRFDVFGQLEFFKELNAIARTLPDEQKNPVDVAMVRQLPNVSLSNRGLIVKSILDSSSTLSSTLHKVVLTEIASVLQHLPHQLQPMGFGEALARVEKLDPEDRSEPLIGLISAIAFAEGLDSPSHYLSDCLLKINGLPSEKRREPIRAAIAAVVQLPDHERKGSLTELLSVVSNLSPSKAADHMIDMIRKLPITLPDAPLTIMLQWILQSSAKLPTAQHANVVLGAISYADGIGNNRTMASVVHSALGYVPLLPDQAQKKVAEMYMKHFLAVSGSVAIGIQQGRGSHGQLQELDALLKLSEGTVAEGSEFSLRRNELRQVMLTKLLEAAATKNYVHKLDMYEFCKHLLPPEVQATLLQKMQLPGGIYE